MFPYPQLPKSEQQIGDTAVESVQSYCRDHIDAARIDQEASIPDEVVQGLGRIGVLGMTISPVFGGQGLSQQNYCRVMEVIGGHCAAPQFSLMHTIPSACGHCNCSARGISRSDGCGIVASGEKLAAFALTEQEAGSDAANVQTRATPTPDGRGFLLNGTKRYITNGALAGLLSVMARTPDPSSPEGKVTCFLVTPDMPGFEVVEARMPKCGIGEQRRRSWHFGKCTSPAKTSLGPWEGAAGGVDCP